MNNDDKIIILFFFFYCETDSIAEADFLINEAQSIKEEKKQTSKKGSKLEMALNQSEQEVDLDHVGGLTERKEGPILRYPFFHVGMMGVEWAGWDRRQIEGWERCVALACVCSGSLRTAAVLTAAPSVSSVCSSLLCTRAVTTPASTCPSRCQENQISQRFVTRP